MLCHSRGFGSKVGLDGFTDVRYNTAADNFLEQVECVLEELNHESIEEIQNGGGVLTIDITHCGSFVLNKQAPNLQLWLSSPLSGPHHYNMVEEEEAPRTATASHSANWLCEKDQHSLKEKLESELSQALGKQIKF